MSSFSVIIFRLQWFTLPFINYQQILKNLCTLVFLNKIYLGKLFFYQTSIIKCDGRERLVASGPGQIHIQSTGERTMWDTFYKSHLAPRSFCCCHVSYTGFIYCSWQLYWRQGTSKSSNQICITPSHGVMLSGLVWAQTTRTLTKRLSWLQFSETSQIITSGLNFGLCIQQHQANEQTRQL